MRIRRPPPETARGDRPSPFSLSATRPFAVQRYTVVAPADLSLENNAQVTTQDIEQTRYGSSYRETTYTTRAGGQNPGTTRVRTNLNTGALTSQASALPSFRVSDGGELAVPDEGQPRNFYAQTATVTTANQIFQDSGATARLRTEGHGIVVPSDPQNPTTSAPRRLKKVHAAEEVPTGVGNQVRLQIANSLPAMNCDVFVSLVMGAVSNASRVAVLQAPNALNQTEIQAPTGREPVEEIATHFTGNQPVDPGPLSQLLQQPVPDVDPGKTAYERLSDKSRKKRSRRIGINESAAPQVGEGFVIRSMDTEELRAHPVPRPSQRNPGLLTRGERKQMRQRYLQILTQLELAEGNLQAGRRQLPATVQNLLRTWGEHYAGVVARDGQDVVTLENYNRRTEARWEQERIFNNLFRDFEQFRVLVSQNVASLDQAPDEATIQNLVRLARQAGHLPNQYQAALDEAEESFQNGLRVAGRTAGGNFFFQMYGPGRQSFHAAYKDIASNPLTLHIREDPADVLAEATGSVQSLNTLVNNLDNGIAAQAVTGVTPILSNTVQQARTLHGQLQLRLANAPTRGESSRIDQEATDARMNLRTTFRNNLIDAYETITGVQLGGNRPNDLQGLQTLVGNYLIAHPGTGLFRGLYAYATGWRQRLLDFQTLLGGLGGLNL